MASAYDIYTAYGQSGNNPVRSTGNLAWKGIGAGAPRQTYEGFDTKRKIPHWGMHGPGGMPKTIRDTLYDPELNDKLREKINRGYSDTQLQRNYGTNRDQNFIDQDKEKEAKKKKKEQEEQKALFSQIGETATEKFRRGGRPPKKRQKTE